MMFFICFNQLWIINKIEGKGVSFHDIVLELFHPNHAITANENAGSIKADPIGNNPINGGSIAPPTIAIMIKDEPSFVYSPRFRIPSAKIVGNIIDMNRFTSNIEYTAMYPSVSTAVTHSVTAAMAYAVNSFDPSTNVSNHVPSTRPTTNRPVPTAK
jgi:hypothetical protein